jgi:hypothetical protein
MDHDILPPRNLPTAPPDDDRVVVSLERHRRRREQRTLGHGCRLPCDGTFCLALSAEPPRVTA